MRRPIGDELYLIAREAIANAFRHARASHIEVVLVYSRKSQRLVIRDEDDSPGRGHPVNRTALAKACWWLALRSARTP